MNDLCCIGHITLDTIITPGNEMHMAGGTSFYFSHAIHSFDVDYTLITAVAETELPYIEQLRALGIGVTALPSKNTVHFENSYGANLNDRKQRVLQTADPFTSEQLTSVGARYYHLGPLLAGDIPLEVIKLLSTKGIVSLDAQGYLRMVRNAKVEAVDWEQKREALPYVTILKVNDHELFTLTDCRDIKDGAQILTDWGVKEVVITLGSKGSVIYHGGVFYTIAPYIPVREVDTTGCGDTYMAGYLYARLKNMGIQKAGEFASAMAGKKVESSGPFTGTKKDVEAAMSR